MALLHDSLSDAKEATDIAKLLREGHNIIDVIEVRRGNHFKERWTSAIQVDKRTGVRTTTGKFVTKLSRVLFEMRADDADRARRAIMTGDLDAPIVTKRQVVL